MTATDRAITKYRNIAKTLRDSPVSGKDASMDAYFNNQYADIWEAAATILEEEIRQDNRYHQEPT